MAADLYAASEAEDFEACVAYREAKNGKREEQGGEDRGETGGRKPKDGGRTLDAFTVIQGHATDASLVIVSISMLSSARREGIAQVARPHYENIVQNPPAKLNPRLP